MSALERKPEVPASTQYEDLSPGSDYRGNPRGPSQLAWRLNFPEAAPAGLLCPHWNSRRAPRLLPQLEKNQEILPSTGDEALFCCGVLREIPPSLLSLKMFLHTFEATQDIPRYTRSERRVHFPASSGKESRCSHSTLRGGSLNLTLEKNSRDCSTISKDPDIPMHSRYT